MKLTDRNRRAYEEWAPTCRAFGAACHASGVAFVLLKLGGAVGWPWPLVVSPWLAMAAVAAALLLAALAAFLMAVMTDHAAGRSSDEDEEEEGWE